MTGLNCRSLFSVLFAATGVVMAGDWPADLLQPEGRTRWELTSLPPLLGPSFPIEAAGEAPLVVPFNEVRELSVVRNDRRFDVRIEPVGVGWVHLAVGPREVTLQYVTVWLHDGVVRRPLYHGYRWLDPQRGPLVTAVWSGVTRGGGDLLGAGVGPGAPDAAGDTKIYANEIATGTFRGLTIGRNRGSGTPISSLTPAAPANAGALISATSWDFSANTTGVEVGSTVVPINASETCNAARCGYAPGAANKVLERADTNFDIAAQLNKNNQVTEKVQRAGDVVIWLRAGAQHEGKTGALGSGESRYCYLSDGTGTRSEVPLYTFTHLDANGYYFAPGDSWTSPTFACEQDLFNQTCGAPNLFDRLYVKACGTHTGTQYGGALKTGVVTVPSGHTFNTVLTKYVADFCVYSISGCSSLFKVDEVRTVNYLWMVPHLGAVARVQSAQNVPDETSWTTVDETDFKFGLFPPRSITVTGTTNTTLSLNWDPGLDVHRITNYKIYWNKTTSGGTGGYAFNSDTHAPQVSFSGTSATISGLDVGSKYFVTVTSRYDFKDPSTNVVTRYESLLYPTQVFGDPSFVYPLEVNGTTTGGTCTPSAEVTGLRIRKVAGGQLEFCWNGLSDPCLTGYRLLGSNNATSASGWTTVADIATSSLCFTGAPSQLYYLIIGRGTGGDGPWGHYGR